MRTRAIALATCSAVLAALVGTVASGQVIWDNGDWQQGVIGANGYSHMTTGGLDRRLLSDFTLSDDFFLQGFEMDGFWDSGAQNLGTGIRLWVREDVSGTPGSVLGELSTGGYDEVSTGGMVLGRPIMRSSVDIANEVLAAGTYWLEMQMQGPEEYFQLTSHDSANLLGEQTWVNYSDQNPNIRPASDLFFFELEINWKLQGEIVPAPGALALFGVAGLVARRRRRA